MNDDDLLSPQLSPPPPSAPVAPAIVVATMLAVGASMAGCTSNPNPGAGLDGGAPGVVVDAGLTVPPDAYAPGVDTGPADAGTLDDATAPGVPPLDAGATDQ